MHIKERESKKRIMFVNNNMVYRHVQLKLGLPKFSQGINIKEEHVIVIQLMNTLCHVKMSGRSKKRTH